MKRIGEKELRNILLKGGEIRENDWYTLNAGYRVHFNNEMIGFITFDLFSKLWLNKEIKFARRGYATTYYIMKGIDEK